MATLDDPATRLHARVFNATTRQLAGAERFVPLSGREAITDAVLTEFASWLLDPRILAEIAAALTAHEVESAGAAGCEHHTERDCQEERARLMAVRLALLTGFGS